MIKQEDVTIIIPHLGATQEQKNSLVDCMISLEETFKGPIIVASNGKEYSAINEEKFAGLLTNRNQYHNMHIQDQGQCKAVNAAAAVANTPYILVTNDDMIFPANWFERLVEPYQDGFDWCVSPTLVEPRPGAPTFIEYFCGGAGGDFDKTKFEAFVGKHYLKYPPVIKNGFNLPFLIKKELWDTIGGYDVNYDPWGSNSDSDLLYKIRLAGIQPVQNKGCLVYHFSQTSGTFEPRNSDYWAKNWDYFISKWGFKRTDDGIWTADFVMPQEERIFRPEWEGKYAK